MITHRIRDHRHDLDYEWSAEVFCEIVKSLWQQMQGEQLVPANYHLHLPTTADGMQELIVTLQGLHERLNMGMPQHMRLSGPVFTRFPDGAYGLNIDLRTLILAWTGLGHRVVAGQYTVHGWSTRSNDVVWYLKHYENVYEQLDGRVKVGCFNRMLKVALDQICWPRGFELRVDDHEE